MVDDEFMDEIMDSDLQPEEDKKPMFDRCMICGEKMCRGGGQIVCENGCGIED